MHIHHHHHKKAPEKKQHYTNETEYRLKHPSVRCIVQLDKLSCYSSIKQVNMFATYSSLTQHWDICQITCEISLRPEHKIAYVTVGQFPEFPPVEKQAISETTFNVPDTITHLSNRAQQGLFEYIVENVSHRDFKLLLGQSSSDTKHVINANFNMDRLESVQHAINAKEQKITVSFVSNNTLTIRIPFRKTIRPSVSLVTLDRHEIILYPNVDVIYSLAMAGMSRNTRNIADKLKRVAIQRNTVLNIRNIYVPDDLYGNHLVSGPDISCKKDWLMIDTSRRVRTAVTSNRNNVIYNIMFSCTKKSRVSLARSHGLPERGLLYSS